MAFLRPDADDVDGGWTTDTGGSSLFPAVDEATAIDTDYIQSPINPSDATCRLSLGNPVGTPVQPFVLRYRIENASGLSLHVRLVQGASTVIASWDEAAAASFTTIEHTLTTPQFTAISDFTNLFVEFTADSAGDPTLVLDLDFTIGTLDSRVTFTRASVATYINASGLVAAAAIDAPRFDHDPVTLLPRGLLIEEQRTNLLLQSDGFPAPWSTYGSGSGVATYLGAGTAPDGSSNAAAFRFNRSSAADYAEYYQLMPTTNAAHTGSLWLKAYTGADVGKQITLALNNGATLFNPLTVILTADWVRYATTGTMTGAGDGFAFGYIVGGTTATGQVDLLAWGGQLELGTFATSYIPTTSASVTRAADVALMTGTNFSSWYNASEGTLIFDGSVVGFPPATGVGSILAVMDVDYIQATEFAVNSTNVVMGTWVVSYQAHFIQPNPFVPNQALSIAYAFKINDYAGCFNGGTVSTDTSAAVMTIADRMVLPLRATSSAATLHYERLRFYNVRKPDAALQTLTA